MRSRLHGMIRSEMPPQVHQVHTRGIPYSPPGTEQDFSCSPRHAGLYELQRELDMRTGRTDSGGIYEGASFIPGVGAQPATRFPFPNAPSPKYRVQAPSAFGGPTRSAFLAGERPPGAALADLMPELGSGYQADLRSDPSSTDSNVMAAAKQRILASQHDSYGEVPRGIVPPPPPLDARRAPQSYIQPRVQITDAWMGLVASFAVVFVLLSKYGA